MKALKNLRDMYCKELEEYAGKGRSSSGDLDTVHKLTDTIKNIDKIMLLEEDADYSRDDRYSMNDRYSRDGDWEARGRFGGHSYARRRDSMGRYSRESGEKHQIIGELEDMMRDADPQHREAIRRALEEIKTI